MTQSPWTDASLIRLNRQLWALNVIQFVCGICFAVDMAMEFPAPRGWLHLSNDGIVHLVSESLVLCLLLVGFTVARLALRTLHQERTGIDGKLRSLRGEFDRVLHDRFDRWNLTAAQRDVALLTLRGLRLSEIARHRGSAEGTVKAHLSAVFRAAGVRTRSELVGLFMEEFLDFAAEPDARPS